jgi:cell division protease FtsH
VAVNQNSRSSKGEPGPQPSGPPKSPGQRSIWTWWIFILFLLLWNVFTFPRPVTRVTIPYSTLLAQIRAGNVTSVHVTGDDVTGTFRRPFTPPSPAPSSAASPAPSGAASPAPVPTYTTFDSTFPQAIGDTGFLPLLEAHHVTIDVSTTQTNALVALLLTWAPTLLLIAAILWVSARAGSGMASQFGFGKSQAKRYTSDQPKVTFNDVAGADEAKSELQEEVDFLREPQKYHDVGARLPKGVLLSGPPGTGKTLLARAVAGEAGVPFLSLNASEFVELFVGVGASRVRDLFKQAKEVAPAIVFIDELDAVGRRRGAGVGNTNDEREQTLNQLLGELDGFDPQENIIVLAATNRPDVLDPALLRPGRFDRQITVGLPDRNGRRDILKIHVRPLKVAPTVNLETVAGQTIGMSGADLANLCNEAALASVRHGRQLVEQADFDEALDRVRLGVAHPQLMDEEERRIVAYHESGHALVAWLTPGADPVHKMTIVPHGQALGVTEQLPAMERHNLSREYIMTRIAVMLGGRAAEEVVFDEITTGAESDLVAATQLAKQMVTRWGMSALGLAAFQADETQPFLGYELTQGRDYSEATAARVDATIQQLLNDAHEDVLTRLRGSKNQLSALAEALLRQETLDLDQLTAILGPPATGTAPNQRQVIPSGAPQGA